MDSTQEIVKQYVSELIKVHEEGTELSYKAARFRLANPINENYLLLVNQKASL